MKKKLYILLVLCLASALLAGCIAAEATKPKGGELSGESVIEGLKETVSDEVSEDDAGSGEMTESVASKGEPNDEPSEDEPSKDEPSDEPIEDEPPKDEPSDEPIEDEPSEDEPIDEPIKDEPPKDEPSDEPIEDEPSEDEPSDEPIEDEPSEDEPITNTAYDWDAQKGWPVFMFREEDLTAFMTWAWPEWLTPYGDPQWEYVVETFKGEELLFHVFTIERDGKTEELLQSLEIPYQSCKEDGIKKLHLNLSYADTVKLVGLMYQAGLVESEDAMVFYLCLCGDPCGETNVVSPELPERF